SNHAGSAECRCAGDGVRDGDLECHFLARLEAEVKLSFGRDRIENEIAACRPAVAAFHIDIEFSVAAHVAACDRTHFYGTTFGTDLHGDGGRAHAGLD